MRVTLKAKLGAIFAVVLALAGVGMYIAIDRLGQLNEQFNESIEVNVARIQLAEGINLRSLRIARDERNFILEETEAGMNALAEQIRKDIAAIKEDSDKLLALSAAEGKKRLEAFNSAWAKYLPINAEVLKLARVNSLADARKGRDAAKALLAKGIDPSAERRREKVIARISDATTFRAVANEWLAKLMREGRAVVTVKKKEWLISLVDHDLGSRPIADGGRGQCSIGTNGSSSHMSAGRR